MDTTLSSNTPLDALPQFLSVAQVQAYLGIGRSAAYDFARQHGVRIGSKTVRIPREAIVALVRRRAGWNPPGR
jgi:predicted DNA-binding transcriptional regulator AlpA